MWKMTAEKASGCSSKRRVNSQQSAISSKEEKEQTLSIRCAMRSYRFAFKMDTEARRGLGYAGVPGGTSSKNRLKGNEGRRLKAKRYHMSTRIGRITVVIPSHCNRRWMAKAVSLCRNLLKNRS
jgi:hypothetical protein